MANTVQITKTIDGRHLVFHIAIANDGASGELVNEVLIDQLADFEPPSPAQYGMVIESIWYCLAGFSATLKYMGLTDNTIAWCLPADSDNTTCFDNVGGIKDRTVDKLGKLAITTSGFTTVGDVGTLIIKVRRGA